MVSQTVCDQMSLCSTTHELCTSEWVYLIELFEYQPKMRVLSKFSDNAGQMVDRKRVVEVFTVNTNRVNLLMSYFYYQDRLQNRWLTDLLDVRKRILI